MSKCCLAGGSNELCNSNGKKWNNSNHSNFEVGENTMENNENSKRLAVTWFIANIKRYIGWENAIK